MILDILEEQLSPSAQKCVVAKWVDTLEQTEQDMFEKVKQNATFNLADLYRKLAERTELPFKMTSFKTHMRGVCTCQH